MNNKIEITNEPTIDGRTSLGKQISDITKAREAVSNQNAILNANISSVLEDKDFFTKFQAGITNATDKLNDFNKAVDIDLKSQNEAKRLNAQRNKEILESIRINKELNKEQKNLNTLQRITNKVKKEGTISDEDAFTFRKLVKELSIVVPGLTNITTELEDNFRNMGSKTAKEMENAVSDVKDTANEAIDAIDKQQDEYTRDVKTAGQSMSKAVKDELSKLSGSVRDVVNMLNLQKLADIAGQFAPTSRQKIQQALQTNFNLTSGEFESFKRDLYDQIDTSLYSDTEIKEAMETLNTTALGSTKTATAYFKDIIRGQKVLGMSAQTQQELLRLGNLTGRNELVFYQNQVAKYLNSSLGLNKQQLEELVNLNANLQMQAADIGIATEAFEKMSMNESAAFERTNTGFGSKYTQTISSLLANTDTAAALLGMDSGELSARLARGESFLEILRSGMGAKEALNVLANGTPEEQTRYFEHASAAWGVDKNTWSVLRLIAQQSTELNKNLATATSASEKDGQKAMETLEEKQYDALTDIQKTVNSIQNFFERNFSWQLLNSITSIGTLLVSIIGLMQIKDSLGELSNLFGLKNLKKVGGLKNLIGGKLTSLGNGSMGMGLMKLGAGTIGTGLAIKDAFQTTNYSDNQLLGMARGALFGTGYSSQSDSDKVGSILGNGAKGALIGSVFGVPGALIGGGIGLILGGIGSLLDKKGEKELTEEEKRAKKEEEYWEAIKNNTYATALNTAKSGVGIVYRYRGYSNYSSMSGSAGMGGPAGGNYNVSSYYGERAPLKTKNGNITGRFHSGTDFAAPEGTPLYSNVTGTVMGAGRDSSGAYYVGVKDDKTGYTHWYWHLQKAASVTKGQHVQQGEAVGYVGQTGNATGPHLHYMVTKPGRYDWWNGKESTVNSLPFATNSIFDGGRSSILTSGTDSVLPVGIAPIRTTKINSNNLGDLATPIVNSIGDLKQTIINLSEQTSRNQKIMDALVNKTMQSPTI